MSGVRPATSSTGAAIDDAERSAECVRIVRYLAGVDPTPGLIDRYARAHRALALEPADERDRALLDCVRRRAWTLPLLDAATGLVAPDSLLRKKILVAVSLVETDQALVDRVDPRGLPAPVAAARLAGVACRAALTAAAGLVLYALLAPGRGARRAAPASEPGR